MQEFLMQYGALGCCMLIFMGFFYKYYNDTKKLQYEMLEAINNNTIALTRFYEVINSKFKRKI